MKHLLIIFGLFIFNNVNCQSIKELRKNYHYTIPEGKKWVIKNNKEITIELSSATLQRGSYCNALFLSNPQILGSLTIKNDKGALQKLVNIQFINHKKPIGTNMYTYNITTNGFRVKESGNITISQSDLILFPNEQIIVGGCISVLTITEYELTDDEMKNIDPYKKQKIEMKTTQELSNNYWNIEYKPKIRIPTNTMTVMVTINEGEIVPNTLKYIDGDMMIFNRYKQELEIDIRNNTVITKNINSTQKTAPTFFYHNLKIEFKSY